MPPAYVIVIGASAGGVVALQELVANLPATLDAAIGIVLHVGTRPSILPQLLSARGPLPAVHAADGMQLKAGQIYVAPPDHHLLFDADSMRLSRGPRENHARPAVDPLFRSAALNWRERCIGVVLTGALDDGTAGLAAIKDTGGIAVVEDPSTAADPSMPASALAHVSVDHCVSIGDMARLLTGLVGQPVPAAVQPPLPRLVREVAIFEGNLPLDKTIENMSAVADPSSLTCPECGGALWEVRDSKPLRYRCHTGHGYSARTLENAQVEVTEQALRSSVRSLQEREMLLRRLADVAESTGDMAQAQAGREQADLVHRKVVELTALIESETSGA